MSVNSIRNENINIQQISIQKHSNSQSPKNNSINSWQNQINQIRGKLNTLAGNNSLTLEEKKDKERQLKNELSSLNEKIRIQKENRSKNTFDEHNTGKSEVEKPKIDIEYTDKRTDTDLNGDKKAQKTEQKTDERIDKAEEIYSQNVKVEETKNEETIDTKNSEIILKLSRAQSNMDALTISNRVDRQIEHQQDIGKGEIRNDRNRGRDTTRSEARIENIDIDISKISKKYFGKN